MVLFICEHGIIIFIPGGGSPALGCKKDLKVKKEVKTIADWPSKNQEIGQ